MKEITIVFPTLGGRVIRQAASYHYGSAAVMDRKRAVLCLAGMSDRNGLHQVRTVVTKKWLRVHVSLTF